MESFCNNYVDAGTIIQKKNINFLEWSIYISNLLTILGLISTRISMYLKLPIKYFNDSESALIRKFIAQISDSQVL